MVQLTSSLNADASQYLSLWFEPGAKGTKVDDSELWQRMTQARQQAVTAADQARMYADIDRYVAGKVYVLVPYAAPVVYDVWSAKVKGLRSEPSSTRLFLQDAWLGVREQ
jgi:hypothetical protein